MSSLPAAANRRSWSQLTVVAAAVFSLLTGLLTAAAPVAAQQVNGGGQDSRVNFQEQHQHIDGFGFSQAFQRANLMRGPAFTTYRRLVAELGAPAPDA